MVKIPEKSPSWQKIIKNKPEILFDLPRSEVIQSLVEKTDHLYYYWDKIRSQPLPKEYKKEDVWAYIRFRRQMNMVLSPVIDCSGNPFQFWLTDSIQKTLHLLDQNIFGENSLANQEKDNRATAKYAVDSLIDESIRSSQIEGAVATVKEAKKMLLSNRKPRDRSEQMIYNNYITMQSIKRSCKEKLDLELLLEMHKSITKETLDSTEDEGRLRIAAENINVVTSMGELLFTPPDAAELQVRLEALFKFANEESEKQFIHPVVKAIILHFWMAYIHPFVDGNGRIARSLFYWYMLKHDYWLFEYLSISKSILKRTTKYAAAYLYSEHDDNDLTYFIHFHIKVIMEAIEELKSHIQIEREKSDYTRVEFEAFPDLNWRQTRIIQHLIDHPNDLLTIKIHQNANNIAYQTARTDLLQLSEKGWLKQVHKGKVFYFVPAEQFWNKIPKVK